VHDLKPWNIGGGPYRHYEALKLAREHARDFVRRVIARLDAYRGQRGRPGLCCFALDTELLGHWWYEGVAWLAAVLDETARQGLALTTLDDALERHEPALAPPELGITSWGEGGDLRTWSAPAVSDLAWAARTAELRALGLGRRPGDRALRELLALQSSDWAFLATRALAGDYPRERARGHAEAFERALLGGADLELALRNLAPELAGWMG
jgi:1,4-alpha-glucan branching enzyme